MLHNADVIGNFFKYFRMVRSRDTGTDKATLEPVAFSLPSIPIAIRSFT